MGVDGSNVRECQQSSAETGRRLALTVWARFAELGQVLLPGVFAWSVTVVPAAFGGESGAGVVTALLALLCLVVGTILAREHQTTGIVLGIYGFLAASVATWLLNKTSLHVDRVDAWRAGAGSIGWALYALGWGTPWRIGHHPEDDPRVQLFPKLAARQPPRFRTALSVAIGTLGALVCVLMAWRIADPDRAVLLHGAALACSVGMISASASVGVSQGEQRHPMAPRERLRSAIPWIIAAAAVVAVTTVWMFGK